MDGRTIYLSIIPHPPFCLNDTDALLLLFTFAPNVLYEVCVNIGPFYVLFLD